MLELLLALKFVEPFKLPVTAAAADEALSKLNAPEEPSPPVDILTARWPPVMFGPNSTGLIGQNVGDQGQVEFNASGSFQAIANGSRKFPKASDYDSPMPNQVKFDLSRSSSIFSGSKLQVASLQCLPCIRI